MNNKIALLGIFAVIGVMAELDTEYSDLLQREIGAVGKAVEDMTVGELLAIHRECMELTEGLSDEQ